MVRIHKNIVGKSLVGIFFLTTSSAFCQIDIAVNSRLDNFVQESCEISYNEITSKSVTSILKYEVFHIIQETKNIYDEKVKRFEHIKTNTSLPKLTSYIREDFTLNQETAPVFQSMLDYIYPIAEWKPDKREFFFKNGKWYFLRDAYFRSKQGFEVSVDPKGKITHICYKMKWDEPDSK